MAPLTSSTTTAKPRERRAHKKSRRGCGNCKLRRVKCGEETPACKQCKAFGVDCTYDGKVTGLRFAGESTFSLTDPVVEIPKPRHDASHDGYRTSWTPPKPRCADQLQVALGVMNRHAGLEGENRDLDAYRIGLADLEMLQKFRDRTVMTVGTKQSSVVYQKEIFQLAHTYDFLKHIVLTLTSLHDQYLHGIRKIDVSTAQHWVKGTQLFQSALRSKIPEESKDALWATAALLGAIQFASFEASCPQEAWPLKPYEASDLDWLKMSDGKKAVYRIADPTRPESAFSKLKIDHSWLYRAVDYSHAPSIALSRDYVDIFGLGPSSTGENNPYHSAAMAQARCLNIACTPETLIEFLSFLGNVNPELFKLIDRKEPKALLLIACWYAKVFKYQWWIQRRGLIEGRALCIYLESAAKADARIERLLRWPRREFGLPVEDDARDTPTGIWTPCASAGSILCVV